MSTSPLQVLKNAGAFLTGHFVYTTGTHADSYVNKDAVYADVAAVAELCRQIATQWADKNIEVVVAPASGGIALSQWTTHFLNELDRGNKALAVYADKKNSELKFEKVFVIKRGYEKLIPGKRILIVEDIVNSGASVLGVIKAVQNLDGNIVGISAICDRGNAAKNLFGDIPIHSLVKIDLPTWSANDCPLCAKNEPINTSVGKGNN